MISCSACKEEATQMIEVITQGVEIRWIPRCNQHLITNYQGRTFKGHQNCPAESPDFINSLVRKHLEKVSLALEREGFHDKRSCDLYLGKIDRLNEDSPLLKQLKNNGWKTPTQIKQARKRILEFVLKAHNPDQEEMEQLLNRAFNQ